jgi:hypothetical protein
MTEQENQTFIYRIDSDNKITYVSSNWNMFAHENGTPELCEANVKGQPLLDFFSGMEVKHLYKIMFDKIRNTKQSIEFPFRCDSPKVRRYMHMKMLCIDPKAIECETRILLEELRPEVELLNVDIKCGEGFVIMCAWCKCVKTPGGWKEVEDAIKEMKLFEQPEYPMITHGICGKCLREVKKGLGTLE